jgi:predicted RNA methylase
VKSYVVRTKGPANNAYKHRIEFDTEQGARATTLTFVLANECRIFGTSNMVTFPVELPAATMKSTDDANATAVTGVIGS